MFFTSVIYIFSKQLILSICEYLNSTIKATCFAKFRKSYKIILQLIKCTLQFAKCKVRICLLIWAINQLNFSNKDLLIKLISNLNQWLRFPQNFKTLIFTYYGHTSKTKIFLKKNKLKKHKTLEPILSTTPRDTSVWEVPKRINTLLKH